MADRIPVDMRRLATQLRRMKDRSGLTVPALAARTAHPVESWERVFAARQLPPLDAVEVLAQASGADYDRAGALWKLAEKASAGTGDWGRGRPVPYPDPLDPLGAEEGLPGRGRRVLLLAAVAALAAVALVAVMLTAGTGSGRAPDGRARPTRDASSVPKRFATPAPGGTASGRSPGSSAGTSAGTTSGTSSGAAGTHAPGDTPSAMGGDAPAAPPGTASAQPPAETGADGTPGSAGSTGSAGAPGTGGTGRQPPGTSGPSTTPPAAGSTGSGGSGATPTASPTPSPTASRLCLGLILLGVCIG